MPVTSCHPDDEAALPRWRRCRDAYAGTDAIKKAVMQSARANAGQPTVVNGQRTSRLAPIYLPMLDGQDLAQYAAYVERALWYGATKRTVQGLTGAVFRKDPH